MWEAAFDGDLPTVKKYATQQFIFDGEVLGFRGECERGGEGETLLHIAVLRKHKEMIFWIVETFPSLVNEIYLKHKYFGETALHIAVVNSEIGDVEIVKYLCLKSTGPLVTGSEFLKDEDQGCLYYGQTILQFAASTHKNKILRYLVENEHDPADLTAVDIYGNNVLHIMAYYGHFEIEVFNYIKNRNRVALENGNSGIDLMKARNKDNLTPFQLGVARGHANIIDTIKELDLVTVRHYRVCIDDLDPIQPHKEVVDPKTGRVLSSSRVSKPLLNVKWALYARKRFLSRFLLTVLLILCFTVAIALQPYLFEDRRKYFSGAYTGNSYPIVRLVFEVISVFGVVALVGGEFKEFFTQGLGYFVGYGAGENVIQWSFAGLVLTIPIFRFAIAAAVDHERWFYLLDTENIILAFAAILGWVYLLNFSKGFKSVGPLVVVFKKILTEDLMQWLALYIPLTAGFAAAYFLQMNEIPYETQGEHHPAYDWNTYGGAVLWTTRYIYAQANREHWRESKLPGFTGFLFVLYGFVVMVLLHQLETFKEVVGDSKRYWAIQFAYLIIDTDEKLSDQERHFLLKHVGWHTKREELQAHSSVLTSRYFLFTERDVPDPSDPSKTITETLKLIIARDHNDKDIEVRTNVDYWHGWTKDLLKPFDRMKKEHQQEERGREPKNMWHGHAHAVKTGGKSVYETVNAQVRASLSRKNE
ncbi:ankyrin repeat-containing domain protein [Obelidium mucronatum]|nr:ankyrin repeat-containing domain protein [Obelidium mucronatum]